MLAPEPLKPHQRITLGEGIELDPSSDELYRSGRVYKLERIPSAVLVLLIERRGQVVRREEILERVWGKTVFLDTDNAINSAIRKIRQALKDDSEAPRFIQTISGKGYRFVGQVDGGGSDPAQPAKLVSFPVPEVSTSVGPSDAAASGDRKRLSATTRVLFAVISAIAIATVVWLNRNAAKSTTQPAIRSLAVLPLKNLSGDPGQEYLADGMTESIIARLSGIRELRVISRTSSMRFKDTKLSVPEIAKQLNVDAIVEGSFIRDANRIRVHAQLIRAATDAHFWSETYDRELKDVLSLQSDVAQAIANKVQVTVTRPERQRLASVVPVPPEVYENYLKGRFALGSATNRADTEKGIAYFQQAIKRDPSFAAAYLGLADAYMDLGTIYMGSPPEEMRRKAMAAASKALELDPQSADAHVLLATMYQTQWQWSRAEAELRRTLELNPNNAAAHYQMSSWLTCEGRTDEAIDWARHARELDPQAPSGILMWNLFVSRRYPEAIRELHSLLALEPNDPGALWFLGYNLIASGQPEEAIPPLEKALALSGRSPGVAGVLIRAYAHAGRRADALRLLTELKQRQKSGYVPAGAFVNAYLGLGETDEAFAALEQAYKEHSNIIEFLKVHPHFDPIRNDPRFKDLVHRVGLD